MNFIGERRSDQTHQSTTNPDSRLFKKAKGDEAKTAHLSEVLMENRHGLVIHDACVVPATGTGERDTATSLIAGPSAPPVAIGGDEKASDTRLREDLSGPEGDASYRAAEEQPHARRADDAARSLCGQSTIAEADRRSLPLDENGGRHAQAPPPLRRPGGLLQRHVHQRRQHDVAIPSQVAGALAELVCVGFFASY